jgi:hypothetical protein
VDTAELALDAVGELEPGAREVVTRVPVAAAALGVVEVGVVVVVVVVGSVVIGIPRWITGFHSVVGGASKNLGNTDKVGGANSVKPLPSLQARTVRATSESPWPDTSRVNCIAAGTSCAAMASGSRRCAHASPTRAATMTGAVRPSTTRTTTRSLRRTLNSSTRRP